MPDLRGGHGVIGVVAESGCAYFAELHYPDDVLVGLRVERLGTSSVTYGLGLFAHPSPEEVGTIAAKGTLGARVRRREHPAAGADPGAPARAARDGPTLEGRSTMTTTSVALLGVGTMGAGMARNIAAAGMPVRVWNRTHEKALALADVAEVCDTAADAVRGADVVVTMLYDTDSIVATMSGLGGSLAGDAVWLQTSTVGVAGSARLGALASDLGIGYVDAPVLGTKKPAEDGTLIVLASGDPSLEARVSGVTDAIGARTLWVGEAGAGSRLKLACNAFVATMTQGIAESLAMTEALGLDPALFLEAVRGAAVDAPYVQVKGRAMVDGQFAPAFRLAAVVKDLDLMLEATEPTGYSPGLVPVLRRYFSAAVDRGLGDEDMAAIYLALDT